MKLYVPYLRWMGLDFTGFPMFISHRARIDGLDYGLISIGDKAVISSDVVIVTHDFSVNAAMRLKDGIENQSYKIVGRVEIGANAFVGAGSILLPGTRIGESAIIGAGSVVRGEVPPRSIAIGNPAKVIADVDEWLNQAKVLAKIEVVVN
ncbi:MAG TPA: acyltransferase [Acidimicrobiales bacterium]